MDDAVRDEVGRLSASSNGSNGNNNAAGGAEPDFAAAAAGSSRQTLLEAMAMALERGDVVRVDVCIEGCAVQ